MSPFVRMMGRILLGITVLSASPARGATVVVYVSEDQVFSEPVLKVFERETGIEVKAVYDTEETKSTGVMNRLIAEKNNPRADVYWANEPIRAEVLKQRGIAAPYFSPNAKDIPPAFKDLEGRWKGRAVIANPLFGTTTTQVAALFVAWGDERARNFMQDIKENGIKLTTSNGESADLVAKGEMDFGLVDSDDAVNRMRQGKPVDMICPDQATGQLGCLILPNAALLLKGAPHPLEAKRLVDYLLSRETERKLAFADCAQIPLHPGFETPSDVPKIEKLKVMPTSYAAIARKLQDIQPYLKDWVGY